MTIIFLACLLTQASSKSKVETVKYSSISKHARDGEIYPVVGTAMRKVLGQAVKKGLPALGLPEIISRSPFLTLEVSELMPPKLLPGRVSYDYWHLLKRVLEPDVLTGQTLEEMLTDAESGDLFKVGPKMSRKEAYDKLMKAVDQKTLQIKDKAALDELTGKLNGYRVRRLMAKRINEALRMAADPKYKPRKIPIQEGSVKVTIDRVRFADGTRGPSEINIVFDEKIKSGEIKQWRIVTEYEGAGSTLKLKDSVNWWRELDDAERAKLNYRKLPRDTVRSLNISQYSLVNAQWRRAWGYIAVESLRGAVIAAGVATVAEGFLLAINGFKEEGVGGALENIGKAAASGTGWRAADLVAKRYFGKLAASAEASEVMAKKAAFKAAKRGLTAAASRLSRKAVFWGAVRVGASLGTKAIPVIGWGLLLYDVGEYFLYDKEKEKEEIKKRRENPAYFYMKQTIDRGKKEEHDVSTRGLQFISVSMDERNTKGEPICHTEDARAVKYSFRDGSEIEIADEVVSSSDPWVPKRLAEQLPQLPDDAAKIARDPDYFYNPFPTDSERQAWYEKHEFGGKWEVEQTGLDGGVVIKSVWAYLNDEEAAHFLWARWRDKYRTQWIKVIPPIEGEDFRPPPFATGDPEKEKWFSEHGLSGKWEEQPEKEGGGFKTVWVGPSDDEAENSLLAQARSNQPRFYWYRDWTEHEDIIVENGEKTEEIPTHKLKDLLKYIEMNIPYPEEGEEEGH